MAIHSRRQQGRRRIATYRTGPEFKLGGMYLEGDPGSVPPNRFRHLENVRWQGGALISRPGMEPFNNTTFGADSCVISIEDFQTDPYRLYFVAVGCPGISATVGFSVNWASPDQSPEVQRGLYKNTATATFALALFDGSMYLGVDDELRKFVLVQAPFGTESLGVGGAQQDIPLATFTGFDITCMAEFDGKLFIGLDAGAGASKIVTWDGLAVRDDLTAIDPPTTFGVWRDRLVVGFEVATNHIRTRAVGDSPGTWTTVNPAAGNVASFKMQSYKDILYITDNDENLWSYDGTTLGIARTVAGSTMQALEVFNSLLYYGYLSSGNEGILGTYDGSSYTDAHKNLTTQVSTLRQPIVLKEYLNSLWVGLSTSTGTAGRLYKSPLTTTNGTWTDELGGSSVGHIIDMVTF